MFQDKCGLDSVGHLGRAVDPSVAQLVRNRLDPEHTEPFRWQFFTTVGI